MDSLFRDVRCGGDAPGVASSKLSHGALHYAYSGINTTEGSFKSVPFCARLNFAVLTPPT